MAAIIENAEKILIQQEFQIWESIFKCSCCIQQNKYKLYDVSEEENQITDIKSIPEDKIFEIGEWTEKSTFLSRMLLCQNRALKGSLKIHGQEISNVQIPQKCHCNILQPWFSSIMCCFSCPCSLPELEINLNLPGLPNNNIGQLVKPYFCFAFKNKQGCCGNLNLDIKDKQGQIKFTIDSKCCQNSIQCYYFRCIKCKIIEYNIKDIKGNIIGQIQNVYNGACKEGFSNTDMFLINFPKNIGLEEKIILINSAIWLDYLQYDG